MNRKHEKKMDLLDLPVAERKRVCLEIRAVLRELGTVAKAQVPGNTTIADRSLWDPMHARHFDEREKDTLGHRGSFHNRSKEDLNCRVAK